MSSSQERDPRHGIVDLDTFVYYVIGFTSDIRTNPPRAEYHLSEEEIAEEFPELIQPRVRLEDCPWDLIPSSIQSILKKGFAAAELPNRKYVDVIFDVEKISLRLISPLVRDDLDMYGESQVSVGLQIGKNPYATSRIPLGNWFIHKIPASTVLSVKGKTDQEVMRILKKTPRHDETFPHTLPQLHDLATFFQQLRQNAVVYR